MFAWIGFKANPDSAIRGSGSTDLNAKTQEDGGVLYKQAVTAAVLFYYA